MKSNFFSLLIFLGLSAGLFSCDKNNDVSIAADEETLMEFAMLATTNSDPATTDSTTTQPSCKGKKSKLTEVAISELPEAATDYITTTYAGATIERAGKTTQGGYIVHVKQTDGTSLVIGFDANGTFVSAASHQKDRGTLVAVESLPSTITDYITTTYSGATIKKAIQTTDNNYVVIITKADATIVGVSFDTAGTFISELTLPANFGKGHRGGKHHKK